MMFFFQENDESNVAIYVSLSLLLPSKHLKYNIIYAHGS